VFVRSYILGNYVQSGDIARVHCQFHPLRSDEGGTVSGRVSSSGPNLQNIPSRDPWLGPLMRSMFIPEPGELIYKFDYSQIEYRLLTHYGVGESARAARDAYTNDPATSFHKWVAKFISEMSGHPLEYKHAKNINFGLVYGMGPPKLARSLGLSVEQAMPIFETYHKAVPFVRELSERAKKQAERARQIRTIGGRIKRFQFIEARDGRIWRREIAAAAGVSGRTAFTHKTLNNLLQGGAADIIKFAMLDLLHAEAPCPLLQVHDELVFSMDEDTARIWTPKIKPLMEQTIKLLVPLVAEMESGANWGDTKHAD